MLLVNLFAICSSSALLYDNSDLVTMKCKTSKTSSPKTFPTSHKVFCPALGTTELGLLLADTSSYPVQNSWSDKFVCYAVDKNPYPGNPFNQQKSLFFRLFDLLRRLSVLFRCFPSCLFYLL